MIGIPFPVAMLLSAWEPWGEWNDGEKARQQGLIELGLLLRLLDRWRQDFDLS